MLTQTLDVNYLKQQVPAWFYRRISSQPDINKQVDFLVPIDWGYGYLLRSIKTKWQDKQGAGEPDSGNLDIKFIRTTRGRELQNDFYPVRLISTPAEPGVTVVAAPAPVDNDIFSVCFTATPVKNVIILNYYYQYRETIYIKLLIGGEIEQGAYVDMLLDGYYIPEKNLPLWK